MARAQQLHEVHVRSARAEVRQVANLWTELHHHRLVRVRNEEYGVRHAGVERVNRRVTSRKRNGFVQLQILWPGEIHRHARAVEYGGDDARPGFKSKRTVVRGLL